MMPQNHIFSKLKLMLHHALVQTQDHLRLQSMRPGMDLRRAWEDLNGVDSEIEEQARYASSTKLGYLTACPTNVGTGIRASVMLHLPAPRIFAFGLSV